MCVFVCACVRAWSVRAFVRACVRARVRAFVRACVHGVVVVVVVVAAAAEGGGGGGREGGDRHVAWEYKLTVHSPCSQQSRYHCRSCGCGLHWVQL